METKIILQEKDIKRAIEEYIISQGQGKVLAIRLEQGDRNVASDPREFSSVYAEIDLEVEAESADSSIS
ncbi:hypothetical protein H6F88_22740 [Oculatella sp. FACHB-28]|uniref:hypothetical protein n=1 Tax=Cyanophyceae TaxID=3028117 RepID=UPI0016859F30|nr:MULTISPECIES: hypothetical protein [Cyanophyceae]MBD2001368.1 hypothetical protein [Leptolyngbya sp. FACHB-541]MBD2058782.1 hypothetical protein [Oculatella sp. FACHB-28]MBD2071621.1 hypothetical protein [Leptolyngbya sp. FACHB-671]